MSLTVNEYICTKCRHRSCMLQLKPINIIMYERCEQNLFNGIKINSLTSAFDKIKKTFAITATLVIRVNLSQWNIKIFHLLESESAEYINCYLTV